MRWVVSAKTNWHAICIVLRHDSKKPRRGYSFHWCATCRVIFSDGVVVRAKKIIEGLLHFAQPEVSRGPAIPRWEALDAAAREYLRVRAGPESDLVTAGYAYAKAARVVLAPRDLTMPAPDIKRDFQRGLDSLTTTAISLPETTK